MRQILCHILSVNFTNFFFCQLCVQWRCPAASRDDRNSIEIFDGGDAYSYAFWYLLSNWLFIIGLIPPPSQTHTVWPNLKFYLVILKKNYFHHADLCIWTHLFYYLLFVLAKHIFKFCYRMSFPPCCISYILDHLWRNIILEMCMYF